MVSESSEMHQLITTITKSALNYSSVKDLKTLPRFAMIQELQAFNQCLYEIIGIHQQLEGKELNPEVIHITNSKLKEKFSEIEQSGVGQQRIHKGAYFRSGEKKSGGFQITQLMKLPQTIATISVCLQTSFNRLYNKRHIKMIEMMRRFRI
ncbi:hypothetical protein ABPG72_016526 [Tetrahymena utriculariae]